MCFVVQKTRRRQSLETLGLFREIAEFPWGEGEIEQTDGVVNFYSRSIYDHVTEWSRNDGKETNEWICQPKKALERLLKGLWRVSCQTASSGVNRYTN